MLLGRLTGRPYGGGTRQDFPILLLLTPPVQAFTLCSLAMWFASVFAPQDLPGPAPFPQISQLSPLEDFAVDTRLSVPCV